MPRFHSNHLQSYVLALILMLSGHHIVGAAEPTIAMMPLARAGLDSNDAEIYGNFLTTAMMESGMRMMERSQMELILQEQGFQQSGACNQSQCAVQVGRLLVVDHMVVGSLGRLGQAWSLNLRLVDVETGEIRSSVSRIWLGAIETGIPVVLDTVVGKLIKGLDSKPIVATLLDTSMQTPMEPPTMQAEEPPRTFDVSMAPQTWPVSWPGGIQTWGNMGDPLFVFHRGDQWLVSRCGTSLEQDAFRPDAWLGGNSDALKALWDSSNYTRADSILALKRAGESGEQCLRTNERRSMLGAGFLVAGTIFGVWGLQRTEGDLSKIGTVGVFAGLLAALGIITIATSPEESECRQHDQHLFQQELRKRVEPRWLANLGSGVAVWNQTINCR